MSSTLWDGLVARYCPSLDSTGNGTTTLHNLTAGGGVVGSNNGTLTNMDAATDWVADTANGGVRALDFDGVNDYIETGYDPSFVQNTRVFTISGWINRDNTTRHAFLGTCISSAEKGFLVLAENSEGFGTNSLRVVLARGVVGNWLEYRSPDALLLTGWYHVAIVGNGTDVAMYINGALQTVTAHPANSWFNPTGGSTRTLNIGRVNHSSHIISLDGKLDDVCVFNVDKSANDIALLASQRGFLLRRPRINRGLINVSR